jgi:hypothetical protein
LGGGGDLVGWGVRVWRNGSVFGRGERSLQAVSGPSRRIVLAAGRVLVHVQLRRGPLQVQPAQPGVQAHHLLLLTRLTPSPPPPHPFEPVPPTHPPHSSLLGLRTPCRVNSRQRRTRQHARCCLADRLTSRTAPGRDRSRRPPCASCSCRCWCDGRGGGEWLPNLAGARGGPCPTPARGGVGLGGCVRRVQFISCCGDSNVQFTQRAADEWSEDGFWFPR